MNDYVSEYLAGVRDELFNLATTEDRGGRLVEAAELIDEVVVSRTPELGDGASERKARLEDELA